MKRAASIGIILVLMFVLSVGVFAAVTKPSLGTYLTRDADGMLMLSTIDTKNFPNQTTKDFLNEFFNNPDPDPDTVRVCTWASDTIGDMLVFYIADAVTATNLIASGSTFSLSGKLTNFRQLRVKYDSASGLFKYNQYYIGGSTGSFNCILFSDVQFTSSLGDPHFQDVMLPVAFVDNDGLISPPDDDSSSSGVPDPETPSAPPAVDFPEIPSVTNEYVPYDTSVWNGFLSWIKSAIGSATGIGFLIFAYIMSILIVIAIVKKFTKSN